MDMSGKITSLSKNKIIPSAIKQLKEKDKTQVKHELQVEEQTVSKKEETSSYFPMKEMRDRRPKLKGDLQKVKALKKFQKNISKTVTGPSMKEIEEGKSPEEKKLEEKNKKTQRKSLLARFKKPGDISEKAKKLSQRNGEPSEKEHISGKHYALENIRRIKNETKYVEKLEEEILDLKIWLPHGIDVTKEIKELENLLPEMKNSIGHSALKASKLGHWDKVAQIMIKMDMSHFQAFNLELQKKGLSFSDVLKIVKFSYPGLAMDLAKNMFDKIERSGSTNFPDIYKELQETLKSSEKNEGFLKGDLCHIAMDALKYGHIGKIGLIVKRMNIGKFQEFTAELQKEGKSFQQILKEMQQGYPKLTLDVASNLKEKILGSNPSNFPVLLKDLEEIINSEDKAHNLPNNI